MKIRDDIKTKLTILNNGYIQKANDVHNEYAIEQKKLLNIYIDKQTSIRNEFLDILINTINEMLPDDYKNDKYIIEQTNSLKEFSIYHMLPMFKIIINKIIKYVSK